MKNAARLLLLVGSLSGLLGAVVWQGPAAAEEAGLSPGAYLPLVQKLDCQVFFDDFSDPASGWPVVDDAVGLLEYLNGEYRIFSRQTGLYRPLSQAPPQVDYEVAADMRFAAPPTDGLLGLAFGADLDGNQVMAYYTFVIAPGSQEYALFRLQRNPDDTFSVFPIQGFTPAAAINGGTAVNHLAAVRDGSQIALRVNGTHLGTWTDGNISGPTFTGLALNPNPANVQADGRYDNFSLRLLCPDGSLAAPAAAGNHPPAPTWRDAVTLFEN